MDPAPCACRGTIAIHPTCFEELRKFYSHCTTCHAQFPPEMRDGLRVKRYVAYGLRHEGTVDEDDCWHGKVRTWDQEDKLVNEYNYHHGDKDGISFKYNSNGIIIKKYNYMYGLKDGLCINYYDSGNIMCEAEFSEGKEHGTSRRYFENGRLAEETTYIDDVCEGISRIYSFDGLLHVCSSFKGGKLDGYLFSFNHEGKIMSRELYKEDRVIETIRY